MADILQTPFSSSFFVWKWVYFGWKLFWFVPEEQAHFLNNWGHSLWEGPARGIMRQKESRWIITWWRHQMETFSASLALSGGIHRSSVNSPHKGQWRGALMFSLICAWINGWVNNRETGDLRRHRAHYDVIVMKKIARKSRPIQCVELDRPSVGQSETALLEILKSYWVHCHAKVRFSLFPYGICVVFFKSRLG